MRISDWSSDVCSSDLAARLGGDAQARARRGDADGRADRGGRAARDRDRRIDTRRPARRPRPDRPLRSEGHTSELQSLMRISYAVFCLKKKTTEHNRHTREYATHPNSHSKQQHPKRAQTAPHAYNSPPL